MAVWEAILLGVVQGLTEFLPISSTAHLVIARQLLGHETPEDAFTTVIQLGTLAAVFAYFRADISHMLRAVVADLRAVRFASSPDSRLAWLIVLGSVPAGVVGLKFKKELKATFYNLEAMAVVAIVFALLMLAAEWWARRRPARRTEDRVTWLDAVWIGLWQAMALMPGASRSGTTITGGLFAGLDRAAAARFSFLLSLPTILAAGLKDLVDDRHKLLGSTNQIVTLVVGLVVSGVVGYLSIAWLLGFLKRYSTTVFVVYRLLLGGTILTLLAAGVLRGKVVADSSRVVADSVGGFSGRQGANGWSYGYWDRAAAPDKSYNQTIDFLPLKHFGGDPINRLSGHPDFTTGQLWTLQDGVYYTCLWAEGGHPNSATPLGEHAPAEHWAVRRWVSSVDGPVTVSGRAGKVMPWGDNWAGGCQALIVMDGATVFSAAMDNRGIDYSVDATVGIGSLVDFLIGPGPSVGVTKFTAVVQTRGVRIGGRGGN